MMIKRVNFRKALGDALRIKKKFGKCRFKLKKGICKAKGSRNRTRVDQQMNELSSVAVGSMYLNYSGGSKGGLGGLQPP
jgi:hypothetical protein